MGDNNKPCIHMHAHTTSKQNIHRRNVTIEKQDRALSDTKWWRWTAKSNATSQRVAFILIRQLLQCSINSPAQQLDSRVGFPMGMRIPWESHGNGNKTRNWRWEWEGMGMLKAIPAHLY